MYRDYISDEMCGFSKALQNISSLKIEGKWDEAIDAVGSRIERILGLNRNELPKLTETGIFAHLAMTRPRATVWLPYKQVMLIVLLKELGDCAAAKAPPLGGRGWYVKALHLLLEFLGQEHTFEFLSLLPNVNELLAALKDVSLPARTRVMLMRYYEREGDYAEMRNQFQTLLKTKQDNRWLLRFGIAFFERIGAQSDNNLIANGLTRSELDALLGELVIRLRP
jgi:hypothetical protein